MNNLFDSVKIENILNSIDQVPVFRGLENKFQKLYELNVIKDWTYPKLKELGLPLRCHGTSGKIDLYEKENKTGMEFKVVKVFKKQLTPSTALYDIGQLSSDAIDLQSCPEIINGFLVVLFVSDEDLSTENFLDKINKKINNDFKNSLKQRSVNSSLRQQQNIFYSNFGFDQPRINDFFAFFVKNKLAVGVIKVK